MKCRRRMRGVYSLARREQGWSTTVVARSHSLRVPICLTAHHTARIREVDNSFGPELRNFTMSSEAEEARGMDRREALKRVAILLGGALSAPTIAGALAKDMEAWAAIPDAQWAPRTLTRSQAELVATIAEHVIPTTDTPGARTAGVHRYIDALLTQHYPDAEKARFVAGVEGVDVRARVRHNKDFLKLTKKEQIAILQDMDRE